MDVFEAKLRWCVNCSPPVRTLLVLVHVVCGWRGYTRIAMLLDYIGITVAVHVSLLAYFLECSSITPIANRRHKVTLPCSHFTPYTAQPGLGHRNTRETPAHYTAMCLGRISAHLTAGKGMKLL